MINIVLVGAGKLGSRHLQALAKLNIPASIVIIDLSSKALEVAKERYNEVPLNPNIKSIQFLNSISSLEISKIDVAIIATTSDFRRLVIEELISVAEIRFMILEKMLFQKLEDFDYINAVFLEKGIKSWVNCPRRVWELYKEIKNSLKESTISELNVIGPNWSLATSSMHFIDLIAYLTNCKEYEILNMDFNKELYPAYSSITGSRESKYLEFYGSMKGKFKNSTYFNFTCLKKSDSPFLINIITDKEIYQIYEELGILYFGRNSLNNTWDIKTQTFYMPFQSELTNKIVESLIENGTSELTEFNESTQLHIPILTSFIQYIGEVKKEKLSACPIT